MSVGVDRTAEELGRAFPGARVVVPRAGARTPPVAPASALVVATPGLEPPVEGGYAAAVLLDGRLLLERPDLRASETALMRWRSAVALVRGSEAGGVVVVCADPASAVVQALVRGDPGGFAARELAERRVLGFPPAVAMASLTGTPEAVQRLADTVTLPPGTEVLGPVPVEPSARVAAGRGPVRAREPAVRLLLRVPRAGLEGLAGSLRVATAARSAKREDGSVRIQIDPHDLA
jgi:primosomal protein N' (replication factor Y)